MLLIDDRERDVWVSIYAAVVAAKGDSVDAAAAADDAVRAFRKRKD